MDNKKILILNLSKGKIGEDASALFGAMVITKLQLAAMSRIDIPEEKRPDFYLYVDEFQNFATDSFADILSEARKYRLNLVMAHQYIGQLEIAGNTKVRDAVFGNVGTIVSFRIGATDSEFLAKEFEPIFEENDLVNLSKYNVYLKLMIDGVASQAFSATTIPPEWKKEGNREKIVKVSRERYAKKREVVEDKIARWSGVIEEENDKPGFRSKGDRDFGQKGRDRDRQSGGSRSSDESGETKYHQPFKQALGDLLKKTVDEKEKGNKPRNKPKNKKRKENFQKKKEEKSDDLKPGNVVELD